MKNKPHINIGTIGRESATTDPIIEEVRADLLRRSQIGIKKYNTTLARTDLTLLQWHQHQYEELLDAAAYTKRIIKELEKNEPNRSI